MSAPGTQDNLTSPQQTDTARLVQANLAWAYPVLLIVSLLVPWKISAGPLFLTANRLVILLYAVWSLLHLFRQGTAITWQNTRRCVRFFLLTLAIWLIYGIVGLLWVKNRPDALRELMNLGFAGLIVLTCVLLYDRDAYLKNLFVALQVITGLMIILMLAETRFGWHLPVSHYVIERIEPGNPIYHVPTGISYNENDQAFLMLLLSSVPTATLILAITNRSRRIAARIASCAGALAELLLILYLFRLAAAYTAIFSFFWALLLALLLIWAGSNASSRRVGSALAIILAGGSALALLYLIVALRHDVSSLAPDGIAGKLIRRLLELSQGGLKTRVHLILEGIRQCGRSFGFGVGANGFKDNIVDLAYTDQLINPHCWLIEILAQYGIIIFVFYGLAIFNLLRSMLKSRKYRSTPMALVPILLVIAFIPGSFAPSQLLQYWPQWLLIGIAFAGGNVYLPLETARQNE